MPDETPQKRFFEFDLGELGGRISINSITDLPKWNQDELNVWRWLNNDQVRIFALNVFGRHEDFFRRVAQIHNDWQRQNTNPEAASRASSSLDAIFQQFYCKRQILYNANPDALFISDLKGKRGEMVAAGAYIALLNAGMQNQGTIPAELFEGAVEAFLYRRNIDWAASAQREAFDKLRAEYESNLLAQQERFREIEGKNAALNNSFQTKLETESAALVSLQSTHSENFKTSLESTDKSLKSLEETYDRKLALQKPVEYWDEKKREHRAGVRRFAWAAGITAGVLTFALGLLIWDVLKGLAKDENPKHWQVGILLLALFFSVWLLRILVRLLLSHHHLATDAAERKVMIQTFIALSREGKEFQPDDKRLILQHIFRAASDGVVKDETTPPTPFTELGKRISG